jgi:hypothetical protein
MRCAACGGLAYEKPQSGLRPFVRFFSGTFCPPLKQLSGFFIAAVKTSHTPGTLCAIPPKYPQNKKFTKNIKNSPNFLIKLLTNVYT